jgi:glycosyltransferase involved in cell wall biosynthesis
MPAPDRFRLAVVASLPPGTVSGLANTVGRLCDGLGARGHQVRLMPTIVPDAPLAALAPGAALDGIRRLMAAQRAALEQAWRAWRPQVVHVDLADEAGHVAAQLAGELGLPLSSRFHGLHLCAPPAHRAALLAQLLAFHRRAARTVAQNRTQAGFLAAQGVPGVACIGNGVDAHAFAPAMRSEALRAGWGAGDDAAVALWVGRLVAPKNTALLLRAGEALRSAVPGVRLVVIGDGPERAELAARLPWARFTGELRGAELAGHVASTDLLLFPSRTDSWGNVVGEAMASGLAVVAFDRGAAQAMITGADQGAIVADGDEDGFIAAAVALAADVARCRRLGQAARQAALRHGWDETIERFEVLVAELASGAAPRR